MSSPTMGAWECVHGVDGRDWCGECHGVETDTTVVHLSPDQLSAVRELLALVHYDDLAQSWLDLLPAELHPNRGSR